MRYYVVFVDGCQWNDTINIVWNDYFIDDNVDSKKNGFAPTLKKELSAEKLEDMFDNKDDKFFIIH